MTANGFDLERENPSERVLLSVEDYKKITNFENTKTVLKDIKLEIPKTPDVKSFGKLVRNRDEKIQELVVEPRDKMIKERQEQISLLYLTLQNQVNTVERASKCEKERKSIMCENRELKEKCENMEEEFIRDFEFENDIYLDSEKQIEYDETQNEYDIEL